MPKNAHEIVKSCYWNIVFCNRISIVPAGSLSDLYLSTKCESHFEDFMDFLSVSSVRSLFIKFILGILPLAVFTGTWNKISAMANNNLCPLGCPNIENEEHVLFSCTVYAKQRTRWIISLCQLFHLED